ncbi:phosphoheptose isomerase [Candidatus Pelagibacter sp.]|nr:phosphoheptose isomerase [Candidatus Pelagibacter sp.]
MLKNKKKIICFDIDNVICRTHKNDYTKSKPIKKTINLINYLYKKGYFIKIFTSRFMGRNNENVNKAKKNGYKLTINQLKKWNIKFHILIMGKPSFDIYIDDKAFGFNKNWQEKFKKMIKNDRN